MRKLGFAALAAVFALAGAAFAQPQSTPISTLVIPPPFTVAPIDAPLDRGFGASTDPSTHQPSFHPGVDFIVPEGTRVVSVADGVISFAGERTNYGLVIEVDHGGGLRTRYAHLGRIDVHAGTQVHKGDEIALSGASGRAMEPKLHFEVWSSGRVIDPALVLPH